MVNGNVQWKDGLIIFIRTFHEYKFAQSIASLLNRVDKYGKEIHLITQSEPSGDEYISCDNVKRHFLDVYEVNGYTPEEAFLKIIGEIPIKTVVFAGDIYANTLSFFQTAQRIGRCTVFDTDRSPYFYVQSGREKLSFSCLYMLRNADLVITHSQTDHKLIEELGVLHCEYVPYYYPYSDSEVRGVGFTGGRIVYYTTYAGRNARTPIEVFARIHDKYPDSKMTVVTVGVKKSPVLDELVNDVISSGMSEYISVETDVLKPLRFLRDCDVSITYSHLITVPETVVESVSLGIPTINIQDADYSDDMDSDVISLCASDDKALEQKLDFYMDIYNCTSYSLNARRVLMEEVRTKIAEKWMGVIRKANELYEIKTLESYDKYKAFTGIVKSSGSLSEAVSKLKSQYCSVSEVFGALLACGAGYKRITEAYRDCGLIGVRDLNLIKSKAAELSSYEPCDPSVYSSRNVIRCDFAARLSVCGVSPEDICAMYDLCIDPCQITYALLNAYDVETAVKSSRMPFDSHETVENSSPSATVALNSYRAFCLENIRYLNGKRFSLVSKAIRLMEWSSRPFASHGLLGKLFLLPGRVLSVTKKKINKHGRKRLMKRKVVEVAPEDVRKIQLMVLKMMLEFERICKKHGLRYYLAGGTILGGIRHGGFIPWDDDMDITMPRPDYEKFLKIAQKELSDEFILDKDCVPFCHNRIEYKNSSFDTRWRNGGIFLDILALDGSPDDENERLKHETKTRYWRTWMLEKARQLPVLTSSKAVQKTYFKRLVARLIPRWFLKWRWHSWAARYSCDETSSWVCLPASIYTYEQERFPKEYWGEPVMMEFEGHMMPTMSHWEDYLICHFGDYMKMPPLTLRKSHHFIYKYDLGKYADISIEELEKELGTKK